MSDWLLSSLEYHPVAELSQVVALLICLKKIQITDLKLGERKRATTTNTNVSLWDGYHGMLVATNHQCPAIVEVNGSETAYPPNTHPKQVSAYLNLRPATKNARPTRHKLIPPLLPYTTYATLGRPTPTITFPLSADHCLITLVQYNVVRAILFNMNILSLLDCLPSECSRSFRVPFLDVTPPEKIPADLQPTPLQESTPHPFWIQAIPFPAMRDNLILLAGMYDSESFRYDIGEGLYEGFDDVERRGFLVWGESWCGRGWEVSQGFVNKWGFLLKGCPEVIESTNRWREVRGEDRLILDI